MRGLSDTALPAGAARGLARFMGAMTALWSVNVLAVVAVAGVVGIAAGLAVVAASFAIGRTAGDAEPGAGGRPEGSPTFVVAVVAEVVVAVGSVVALVRTGNGDYVLPVIALIVALHFFIFLTTQRVWLHAIAGTVGTLGALTAIVAMATGAVDADAARAVAAGALALCTLAYGAAFLRLVAAPGRSVTPDGLG